jgi:hypothetical protein
VVIYAIAFDTNELVRGFVQVGRRPRDRRNLRDAPGIVGFLLKLGLDAGKQMGLQFLEEILHERVSLKR